uniref:Uncharacterized protein n=1 Tax=Rhizophora mucronata TaxID=61149 RepID=A0A2P2NY43_RHIMU
MLTTYATSCALMFIAATRCMS